MLQHSETAQVIGRSMEPVLCEGDLIEVGAIPSTDALVGSVYCFRLHGLDRPAAHRLVEKGEVFRFRGDRQPFVESIHPPETLHEVRRVLERARRPDAEDLLFSLLLLEDKPDLSFPSHCTLYWPWEDLLLLGQKHRLNAMIVHVLKKTGLWRQVPTETAERFSTAWHEAIARAPLVEQTLARACAILPHGRPLKGARLRELYPSPFLRIMEDVDLLVPVEDFERSLSLLQGGGFRLAEEDRAVAEFYSSVTLTDPETGIGLDLHRAPFQPERFRFQPGALLEDPAAETEFVYLAAHLFQHWGRHGQGLLDLKLLIERRRPDLLRSFSIARQNGALGSFLFACRQLHRWFNLPVPDFSESGIPIGVRFRLALAEEFYAHQLRDETFSRRKHILQLLLCDSLPGFWRLYRDPARRRMGQP